MRKSDHWDQIISAAIEQSFEGIGIADINKRVMYVNSAWAKMHGYDSADELIGKSIDIFHNHEQIEKEVKPFIQVVFGRGKNRGEMGHIRKDGTRFPTRMTSTLVKNKRGMPIAILGIAQDISELKQAEEELIQHRNHLEELVAKRTEELKQKTVHLEEFNIALKVLLRQREKDKKEIQENILKNVEKLVFPYLEKLKTKLSQDQDRVYLEIIESNLKEMTLPFAHNLSGSYSRLTPAEIQTADLIRKGKTTKEIASLLKLSPTTIATHRQNIRRKLAVTNKKTNLRTLLETNRY